MTAPLFSARGGHLIGPHCRTTEEWLVYSGPWAEKAMTERGEGVQRAFGSPKAAKKVPATRAKKRTTRAKTREATT